MLWFVRSTRLASILKQLNSRNIHSAIPTAVHNGILSVDRGNYAITKGVLVRNSEFIVSPFEWTAPCKGKRTRVWSITETKSRNHFWRDTFSCLETKEIRVLTGFVSTKNETEINQSEQRKKMAIGFDH